MEEKVHMSTTRYSGIGGQAVLEGIMMKNQDVYSVGVRKPDGEIEVHLSTYEGIGNKRLKRLPIVRGVISFVDSLVLGMKCLTFSASFYDEEETQPSKADQLIDKLFGEKAENCLHDHGRTTEQLHVGLQDDFHHPHKPPLRGTVALLIHRNKERVFRIVKMILIDQKSALNVYDLCDEFCISYSLLKNDIQKMNLSFAFLNIRFITRNNMLQIQGAEQDKRKLMNHMILEEQNKSFANAEALKAYFPVPLVDTLLQILNETHNQFHFYLNDFMRSNLFSV